MVITQDGSHMTIVPKMLQSKRESRQREDLL
jgi:hypothetical protein